MKDIGSMSPAELLAEWRLQMEGGTPFGYIGDVALQGRISRALDEKCEKAGIFLKDGSFAYYSHAMHWDYQLDNEYRFLNIPATDQQALQEWLLIRPKTT